MVEDAIKGKGSTSEIGFGKVCRMDFSRDRENGNFIFRSLHRIAL